MEWSDAEAVAKARTDDPGAFRVLVERHSRAVFRLAFRMTGNEQDAEDIVQETFLRAYRSLGQFDERSAFSSWLYRIAANRSLDLLRSRKMRSAASLSADGADDMPLMDRLAAADPDPERLAFSGQLQERIGQAMDRLTPQERVAFTLRHFEGRSIDEICSALESSESVAKHAVFRAVRKLRKAVQSMEGQAAWRT